MEQSGIVQRQLANIRSDFRRLIHLIVPNHGDILSAKRCWKNLGGSENEYGDVCTYHDDWLQ